MTESSVSEPRTQVRHMDALPVGTRLAEFEILSLLGVGGFGMVYKAFDHSLHRAVAIKEYLPASLVARANDGTLWARSSTDEPAFQAGLHSFVDEARMLAQFDHPSLVKVFRFWESHNTAYMVMPLYRGMTFKQARAQMRTPPPEAWLRQVLWSVLGALRVLHDANTLHRDISPDNIFLQDVGPPVLLDLGASRHAINDRDHKHTAVLKVNYAPIEQYSDGEGEGSLELEQGPWSDLYSLGAVVHGCLCNDAPLPATLRSLRDRMVPFSRVVKTVRKQFGLDYSTEFVAAISQSLKLQPEERPQNIDAFLATMAMTSPPLGLEQFDFRAELGDIWVEPTDQPDATLTAPTVDLTGERPSTSPKALSGSTVTAVEPVVSTAAVSPPKAVPPPSAPESEIQDTVFLERDSVLAEIEPPGRASVPSRAEPATLESQWSKSRTAAPARRPRWLWLGVAASVVVLGAAAVGLRHKAAPPVAPAASPDAIITELKSAPTAPVETSTLTGALPSEAPEAAASDAAIDAGPPPAFVTANDPRAAPRMPARAVRTKEVPPAELPVPAPAPTAVAPPPPPVPAPVQRKAPPPPLCSGTNALTRSMCLRDECNKPGNANRSDCIEFRRAIEPLERNNFAN
ncbi:serine/threonine protein kinase [Simplicispira suum]|uniref:non-specific serine/threonine protein kinase n=1 Tax=Simplicispira suum TaxID=2109915 RepID=A0A2S0N139_9BURK|nr:serine/threonine-protein kinase [Simplicispira suum]AVO41671.1 serine/threonine protein kinase [Simplicispira suum]